MPFLVFQKQKLKLLQLITVPKTSPDRHFFHLLPKLYLLLLAVTVTVSFHSFLSHL